MITDMLSRVWRKTESKVDAALLGNPPSLVNLSWAITLAGSQLSWEPAELSREPCLPTSPWVQGRDPTSCHDELVVNLF